MAAIEPELDLFKELATYENLVHAASGLVGGDDCNFSVLPFK